MNLDLFWKQVFSHRLWTLDHVIISQVFYHSATTAQPTWQTFFQNFSHFYRYLHDLNTRSWDYESSVLPQCYRAQPTQQTFFSPFFSFLVIFAQFEHSIMGLWVKCSTSALPWHNQLDRNFFHHFSLFQWFLHDLNTRSWDYESSVLPQRYHGTTSWQKNFFTIFLFQRYLQHLNTQA